MINTSTYITISNKITILFIGILFFISCFFSYDFWDDCRQGGDGLGYYVYLPSFFIHKDIGTYNKTIVALRKYNPNAQDFDADIYGFRKTSIGKLANKYPIGLAILQSPFFFAGHFYTKIDSRFESDGFSKPYQIATFFSTFLYVLLGLWFLIKVLNKYFSTNVINLTILILAFGTNLYYFSYFGTAMSHGYQFAIVCLYIYFNDKYLDQKTIKYGILLGVFSGLIVIIRQPDIIFLLISVFWNVNSIKKLKDRFKFYFGDLKNLFFPLIGFIAITSLQIYSYYFISGKLYYYSYIGESFNWKHPEIYKGLFYTGNGWFAYTPVMLFAIFGLIIKNSSRKVWFLSLITILPLHIYITYSWWCWYYIAGFGSRPMVDIYPLCSFAIASFLTWLFASNNILKLFFGSILLFFTILNLKFTFQQHKGILYSQFNNKGYYRSLFFKLYPNDSDLKAFNTNSKQPDTSKILFNKNLYFNDFESDTSINVDSINVKFGKKSLNLENGHIDISKIDLKDENIKKGDWLNVSLDVFLQSEGVSFYDLGKIVIILKNKSNDEYSWRESKPTALFDNKDNSIWYSGRPNIWGNVNYFIKVPIEITKDFDLEIFSDNSNKVKWNIDNLSIDLFKNKN